MKYFIVLLSFISLNALAESVDCVSSDNIWKIDLNLNNSMASEINFYKNDRLVKSFRNSKSLNIIDLKFPKRERIYEINLGGIRYLDIVRPYKGNILSNRAEADFMLTNNPVEFSKAANCIIK